MEQASGRREKKKLAVREKIIHAAFRLFKEKGFKETTVADIMNEADLGTGTFYNYFTSKEDLINHCIKEKIFQAKLSVDNLEEKSLSVREKLSQIILKTGEIFEDNRVLVGLFLGVLKINPDPRKIPSHGSLFKEMLTEVVQQGQINGELTTDIPVYIIVEMVHGIFQSTLSSKVTEISIQDNLQYKIDMLFEGIRQKGGSINGAGT